MRLRDVVPGVTNRDVFELNRRKSIGLQAGLITFDTSALLDLYALDPIDLDALFVALGGPLRPRIWLTHQVATEYMRGRDLRVVPKRRRLEKLLTDLDDVLASLEKKLLQPLKNEQIVAESAALPEWRGALDTWLVPHRAAIRAKIASYENYADEARDPILRRLDALLEDRVGPALDMADHLNLLRDGPLRYEFKIPPGYEDSGKKGNQDNPLLPYGDLLVWEQLVRLTKARGCPAAVLVTSDVKDDWFEDVPAALGGDGRRMVRRDLVAEFDQRIGAELTVVGLEEFLEAAQELRQLAPVPREELGQLLQGIKRRDAEMLDANRFDVLKRLMEIDRERQRLMFRLEDMDRELALGSVNSETDPVPPYEDIMWTRARASAAMALSATSQQAEDLRNLYEHLTDKYNLVLDELGEAQVPYYD